MTLLRLALKSARFRRTSLLLTVFSIALSVALLLGVDKIRKETRSSFLNTVSQTDLIVGARSGPTNLLLYSVFRIGNATNNVSWETYEEIAAQDEIAWTVPISLGDSHRGYRVLGTTTDYFEHYRHGDKRPLTFDDGEPFSDVYHTVLGADVARTLGYELGDEIVLSHGLVSVDFADHDDKPFTVVGILAKTGTPVDRTVHVSLAGIEAIHIDWQGGIRSGVTLDAEQALKFDLTPTSITAFMVGLENRALTFRGAASDQRTRGRAVVGHHPRCHPGRVLADGLGGGAGALRDLRLRVGGGIPRDVDHDPLHPERAPAGDRRAESHRCPGPVMWCS